MEDVLDKLGEKGWELAGIEPMETEEVQIDALAPGRTMPKRSMIKQAAYIFKRRK